MTTSARADAGPTGPPVIDVTALVAPDPDPVAATRIGRDLVAACEHHGFLQVVGHGVDPGLRADLERTSREFFALPDEEKDRIAMRHAGAAWRGWFPVGGELTSGRPDGKEGIYFGTEIPASDPRAVLPLHGPNLFPARPPELGPVVLRWIDEVTRVGQRLLSGIALGLDLPADWFDRWCADPTVLFRIFHYPPARDGAADATWGVAEHTDYGLLTLLAQDDAGGLEVQVDGNWLAVDPVPDAFVCNIGDMLERASGGRFRSTPHRVGRPDRDRCSFPLFLDPGWDAVVEPLPGVGPVRRDDAAGRWDGESVFDVDGTYGEYLSSRVARVFPELFRSALDDRA